MALGLQSVRSFFPTPRCYHWCFSSGRVQNLVYSAREPLLKLLTMDLLVPETDIPASSQSHLSLTPFVFLERRLSWGALLRGVLV